MSDDWQKQVDWMRKNGVISAKWENLYGTTSQRLTECILGPAPESSTPIETADEMKARHEREAKEQQEYEDLRDFGAS